MLSRAPLAPHRPLDAARNIDHPVVVLLEVDAEKAQDLFGEPADVGDGALIKLVEIRGPGLVEEAGKLRPLAGGAIRLPGGPVHGTLL